MCFLCNLLCLRLISKFYPLQTICWTYCKFYECLLLSDQSNPNWLDIIPIIKLLLQYWNMADRYTSWCWHRHVLWKENLKHLSTFFSKHRSKKSDHTVEVFRIKQWYLKLLFASNIGAVHIWGTHVKYEYHLNHFSKFPLPPWEMFCADHDWYIFGAFVGIKNNKLW